MKYPSIKFLKLSLNDNIDIIKWAYNQVDSLNTKNKVIDYFPGINEDNIDELVTKMYSDASSSLDDSISNYLRYWNSISNEYFSELFDYLSIDRYEESLTIYVGLLPIAPRDIQNKDIYINIGMPKDKLLNILTHEVLHFIWFYKFKKLFSNIDDSEFDSPHVPWIYSELVTPILLNMESIVKLTSSKEECLYDFMTDEVMSGLNEIFKSDTSIDDKIKSGYEFVKKHFNKR